MELVTVDHYNIEHEHICCALSDKKGETCVSSKKAWLKERFEDGLVFTKLNERGKVFIEYMPCEKAFAPIGGAGYMYISCFWVSGKYKGKGYGRALLEDCIEKSKAKGKSGLIALGSKKKMHFLSDPKFLKYMGFEVCDRAGDFELLYLPFEADDKKPKFLASVSMTIEEKGVCLYYSNGCPHTAKYVPLVEEHLKRLGLPHKIIKIKTLEDAKKAPVPCTNYGLYIEGAFVTSEVLTIKKLDKYLKAAYG